VTTRVTSPLVSCIMPTRNRRRFVSQAIGYFLRQDYPNRELVIVDDGDDSIANLVPPDSRIRYHRLDKPIPLGAKRNFACELSTGELIAHWDDDDWMAVDRLSVQVAQLLAAGADACGLRNILYYRPDAGDAWLYSSPDSERSWLAGGTLVYRRAVWAEHHFQDLNIGEDTAFVSRLTSERLRPVADTGIYVALIHPGNTAAKNLTDPRWRPQPMPVISRLLDADRDFYVRLRNGHVQRLSSDSLPRVTPVTVCAQFDVTSGYGSMAEYLVLGMSRAGAEIHAAPIAVDVTGMTGEFCRILQRSRGDLAGPVLYFSWPRPELSRFAERDSLFINTMWESSLLPPGWAAQLNQARAVIVPTRFVAQVCRDSGVTIPVEVIPEGIDPAVYHYEERPERDGLTTLIVAPVDDRKHVLTGVQAWKSVFGEDPQAKLIIKTSLSHGSYVPDDPRILYEDRAERTRGIAHWYRQADVLLALGNEGFGLPLAEGMATGLPVIALNSEGQRDICEEAPDLLLPVQPAEWREYTTAFGPGGVRGIPETAVVAQRLRWVAEHRDQARAMGRAASEWVSKNRNVWRKGPAVLDVMEVGSRLRPTGPLRTARTIWVPSWRSACGIAEHVGQLVREMVDVRVTSTPPDIRGLRLLHVEHEHGLFRGIDLHTHLRRARECGVPVVITEHAVVEHSSAFEAEASLLIAPTRRGVEMLHARWGSKRIEHVPLGCHTWFPRRKQRRETVLGAFGFLETHKGFWRLFEVLRRMPGTRLLLFSHARSPDRAARWAADAAGLPVCRIGDFLPAEEVARRLAAEADALVFWYDNTPHASASAAVRVGLATGVPVLTSPTSWFSDLTEETYQPDDLVGGVRRLLDDTALRDRLTAAAREYCEANSWSRTAERHLALWQSLERSA
jgi:glycosyltransferase involved in cell wall biosynthesis